jgi:type VI secretion system protein VasD
MRRPAAHFALPLCVPHMPNPRSCFPLSSRRIVGWHRCAAIVTWGLALGGCASSGSGGGVFDKALDLVGLQTKPALPEMSPEMLANMPRLAKRVTLRIHAGDVLNLDAAGRPLALVAKLYKLKDAEPFLQAPYDTFKDSPAGRPSAIEGVIEVREIVLTPGQKYEVTESMPADATHLAIVGLFRAPDERRWRFAFDAKSAAKTGITIGAHGCAFSVSEGLPVNASPESLRLAGVRCR